jgi:hypothetical protein
VDAKRPRSSQEVESPDIPGRFITLRVAGRLHHIGVGRTYSGTRVLILIQDLHVKIVNAATGELTLDLTKDYQPTGAPKGAQRKKIRT